MPGEGVNATVAHLKRRLPAGRVAFPANECSRDVVQARLVRRAVVPDAGSATETESSRLRVDLVRIDTDRCAGFQDHRRELEGRHSVSDIFKCPSADICARTTRVRNLDVLVGFRSGDDAIEKYAGSFETSRG